MNEPVKGFNPKTRDLLTRIAANRAAQVASQSCAACNGTGRNSRGGYCYPCLNAGRINLAK